MKTYRMYVLVLRQLDGINKGIQAAHACMEYAEKYKETEEWKQYVNVDKTLIVLNGGVTTDLLEVVSNLEEHKVNHATFQEPDLGNITTAVAFILEDKVFNKKDYPSFNKFLEFECLNELSFESNTEKYYEYMEEWVKMMGGETNAALRNVIDKLHFA